MITARALLSVRTPYPRPMDRDQPEHVRKWQRVLNQHWPLHPERIKRTGNAYPVTCRVVFERDGETWLTGVARRWDAGHVWVEVTDRRLWENGTWLAPRDVYRAAPESEDPVVDEPHRDG